MSNNQASNSTQSYLHQFQKQKKNPGGMPGLVTAQHPQSLSMHHSSRKQINAALQQSMKGLNRYEAHLGIEPTQVKPTVPTGPYDYNRHYGRQYDSEQEGPSTSQGQGMDSYRNMAHKKTGSKKRVQFVEESLESSINDTAQLSQEEPDDQDEDDEIIDDQMILTHEQHDDGPPLYQSTPKSISDKIIDKQMLPKEGFNKKQKGGQKAARAAGFQTAGSHQTSYAKLNKDKKSNQFQNTQGNFMRPSKSKQNVQSASASLGARKDQTINYNPKLGLKDQIQMIDNKLSTLNAEDVLQQIGSKSTTNFQSSLRGYNSNPRLQQQRVSNSHRFAVTTQRRILSLDRASSLDSNQGITPVRDSSMMRSKEQQSSKQKLRRKGSAGLPDFQVLNKKTMKKRLFNQVLDKNRQTLANSHSNNLLMKSQRGNTNKFLSPRPNLADPRDKKSGKVQITNINVKASAKQNLQEILGNNRGRQYDGGYASDPLLLEAQQYSSSYTAQDQYDQTYLNGKINEGYHSAKTGNNGGAGQYQGKKNKIATLKSLKEGGNQLDVPANRANYRSFGNLQESLYDNNQNLLPVPPQVYEEDDNLNNIILSNDFTGYGNQGFLLNNNTYHQDPSRESPSSRLAEKQKQMVNQQKHSMREMNAASRSQTDQLSVKSDMSYNKDVKNNNYASVQHNKPNLAGSGNGANNPNSQQSSAYYPTPKQQSNKTQLRQVSDNPRQKAQRLSSQAISDKSESFKGQKQYNNNMAKAAAAGGSNPHEYYLTNDSARKAMKAPESSRNAANNQGDTIENNSIGQNEAGSVYRSEFSASKKAGGALNQQNSTKTESFVSRNETTGMVPQERPEYAKYYELVKKRVEPLNLESVGDGDVTLDNNDNTPLQLNKISQRHDPHSTKNQNQVEMISRPMMNAKRMQKQQQDRFNIKKPQNIQQMKKSATSAQLSANKRKQVLENGPFQRTEAMLFDPQQVSVMPESEALSQSHRTQNRKKNNETNHQQKQKEPQNDSKNFLKTNIGDFKQKILGAMHSTNQAIQNAGKKPDGLDGGAVMQSNEKTMQQYESIYRESSNKSQKCRSPSANQFKHQENSLVLVPEPSFPIANSEVQNTYDFYKSGDDIRQLKDEKSNNNSEVQFRATERSQQCPQYQQELNQAFLTPNNTAGHQQDMKIENGAIEINKDDLDDLYKQSEKLGKQIRLRNNQDNAGSLKPTLTNGSDSNNMCGPFPNRYDRFQSPHQDYSNKVPYGSKSIQGGGGGYMNRISRYQRSNSKYSQANNQFDKQSRAYTTSKIDELMKNQKIQEILLEPNDQFENLLLSDHHIEGEHGQNNNDIETKVETLLTLLNNFMLRHGVTQLNVPGSADTEDQIKSSAADGFSPSEQFLLNAIDKLSNYIEVLQARETAQKHQQIKSGVSSETNRFDYPGTAATPNSMFAGNKLMTQLSPNAQKAAQRDANIPDSNVYQKLALAEVKMKRLIGQISEMNIEYKCQKTQVEALEKFNESLNNQIKRLEHQLYETQSHIHQQSKTGGSGVFGIGAAGADRTPRQLMLEEKIRQREQGIRSRDRLNSHQLQVQTNNNNSKSSLDFNTNNYLNNPMVGNTLFSPKSTKTFQQLGNEPFKSVEVTENCSVQGIQQNLHTQHNPPSHFNFNDK